MAGKKILLVEGADDRHVFLHLCKQHHIGIQTEIDLLRRDRKVSQQRYLGVLDEIKDEGDVTNLVEEFQVGLKGSAIEALGVVLDADTDVSARWDAIESRLTEAGYSGVPRQPSPEGTILDPPADTHTLLPRIGVWIMPDNQSAGKLEHFIRFLIPANKGRLLERAELSVREIPDGERLFSKPDEIKAVVHTWLAWQKEPGLRFGTAIAAKFLDPNVPQADVLVSWLKRLFFPGAPAA
jgi:hypothetical protein